MESIKKTIKNLKQSNFGKKIYDNLISNYGDYLNVNKMKTDKKTATVSVKKPSQKKEKSNSSNWTSG